MQFRAIAGEIILVIFHPRKLCAQSHELFSRLKIASMNVNDGILNQSIDKTISLKAIEIFLKWVSYNKALRKIFFCKFLIGISVYLYKMHEYVPKSDGCSI